MNLKVGLAAGIIATSTWENRAAPVCTVRKTVTNWPHLRLGKCADVLRNATFSRRGLEKRFTLTTLDADQTRLLEFTGDTYFAASPARWENRHERGDGMRRFLLLSVPIGLRQSLRMRF